MAPGLGIDGKKYQSLRTLARIMESPAKQLSVGLRQSGQNFIGHMSSRGLRALARFVNTYKCHW